MSTTNLEPKDAAASADGNNYPTGWKLGSVVVALVLTVFLASLDMVRFTVCLPQRANPLTKNIIATAIPRITEQFHALDDIGWYGSALFLTVASSQSVWGKAYKFFDLKTVFLVSVAIFEIGSLVCGTTTAFPSLDSSHGAAPIYVHD